MATKIRLQRHGKKGKPFYHIVAIDSKAKREGSAIERLGSYNPNTNPATIELNFERALYWVKVGAQPTDTMRAMLSYKGVLHKHHLDNGVKKGAFTQEVADAKFEKWLESKSGIVHNKKSSLAQAQAADKARRLAAETEVKEAIAKKVLAKNSELAAEVAVAEETAENAVLEAETSVASESAPEAKVEEVSVTEENKELGTEKPAE